MCLMFRVVNGACSYILMEVVPIFCVCIGLCTCRNMCLAAKFTKHMLKFVCIQYYYKYVQK